MKQTRRHIFETNSSSTHTLDIVSGDIDVARNIILEHEIAALKERLSKTNIECTFYASEYISNDILMIHNLPTAEGEEEYNDYVIYDNWLARLVMAGIILYNNIGTHPDAVKMWETLKKKYKDDYQFMYYDPAYMNDFDIFKRTPEYKEFCDLAVDICKEHGYDVKMVAFATRDSIYFGYENSIPDIDKNAWEDGYVEHVVSYVMNPQNVIMHRDIAYRPYRETHVTCYV